MSLFTELMEYSDNDEKIVKSFQTKDELCPVIYDQKGEDYIMKSDIRDSLLKISDDFIESLGVEFFIHDIVLTGSLSNYNWSSYSDIDLHILIDFEETDVNIVLLKEFFDAKKNVWNKNHDIDIKGFEVEIYVQDVNEKHISSGVYSVLNDKWEVIPDKKNNNIDDRKILEKGEEFGKKIDQLIKKSKSQNIMVDLERLRKKLKDFRQGGLESGGEYSYENLTFKLLRRNGYIGKMLKLKSYIRDKKLSVTQ